MCWLSLAVHSIGGELEATIPRLELERLTLRRGTRAVLRLLHVELPCANCGIDLRLARQRDRHSKDRDCHCETERAHVFLLCERFRARGEIRHWNTNTTSSLAQLR